MRTERKGEIFKDQGRKREEREGRGQFYRDSFTAISCRESKLDTGEGRMNQRMRRGQKIRTHCQS